MNAHVEAVLTQEETGSSKGGPYTKLRSEERAQIAQRAMEHGVASTVRYCTKKFPGLKESSVGTWRNTYKLELKKRIRYHKRASRKEKGSSSPPWRRVRETS